MSLTRYINDPVTRVGGWMVPSADGPYVRHSDYIADIAAKVAAMQARAEKAEATLHQWRKAYTRNILSHDEEEDDEAAHLHAAACADQATLQPITTKAGDK